jgi:uncharacterized YccA/Bax inhibitor family protein
MAVGENPIIRRADKQYSQEYSGPGFASVSPVGGAGAPPRPGQQPAQFGSGSVPPTDPSNLHQMYGAPSVAGPLGNAMTIHDVIVKTAISFVVLLFGAAITWTAAVATAPAQYPAIISPTVMLICFGSAIVAFGIAMINIFKREISPALVLAYALFEGAFLGGISYFFQKYGESNGWGNLVATAVIATFVVFAVMLTLYTKQIIKVTNRFKKILMVSLISYMAFAILSLIAAMFGVGDGWGFFGGGPIGILISAGVVVLAAFCLCLDFDQVAQAIRYGVPERESWRMAFGLMVTIVWLYLQILRLLALLSRN